MPRPVVSVIPGDFNLSATEVAQLATACGGVLARGHGPDHAIVIGAKVVDVHVLGKNGSDAHHAILFVLDADGHRVRLLLWNVWVGQRPQAVLHSLRRLIRAHKPDVVVLNEAYRCVDVLRRIKGFDVFQGPDVGEGADVAVLVASDHETIRSRALYMDERWEVVSKDRVREGREYRAVRSHLAGDGPALRALGIHFPTDNKVNEAAVAESKARVIEWATKSQNKEKR